MTNSWILRSVVVGALAWSAYALANANDSLTFGFAHTERDINLAALPPQSVVSTG